MEDFCSFINACPSVYHFIDYVANVLRRKKFVNLLYREEDEKLAEKGFIVKDGKEIIAYRGFNPENISKNKSLIFFADLSKISKNQKIHSDFRFAGQVTIDIDGKKQKKLFDSIDSIGFEDYETESFVFDSKNEANIKNIISNTLNIDEKCIVDFDISQISSDKCVPVGLTKDFICGPSLSNFAALYYALKSFIENKQKDVLQVISFANSSDLIENFLNKIIPDPCERVPFISRSFSVDLTNIYHGHCIGECGKGPIVYCNDIECIEPFITATLKAGLSIQKLPFPDICENLQFITPKTLYVSLPLRGYGTELNTVSYKDVNYFYLILMNFLNNFTKYQIEC